MVIMVLFSYGCDSGFVMVNIVDLLINCSLVMLIFIFL